MPRLSHLDDVMFPVEEHPIYVSIKEGKNDLRLPVPEKKAIVNAFNHPVHGIVSRAYRLVSNREALDMAKQCCRTVFPEATAHPQRACRSGKPIAGRAFQPTDDVLGFTLSREIQFACGHSTQTDND